MIVFVCKWLKKPVFVTDDPVAVLVESNETGCLFEFIDVYVDAKTRNDDQADDYHGEAEHHAEFKDANVSLPGQWREHNKSDKTKKVHRKIIVSGKTSVNSVEALNYKSHLSYCELPLHNGKHYFENFLPSFAKSFTSYFWV